MKYLVVALALLGATVTGASAQDAVPDLKGTWTGKGKTLVFGNNPHHPGPHTLADAPRVREVEATLVAEGQEGRLVWGRFKSAVADTKDPFAWAISSDNKTINGASEHGYYRITLLSPDRIENCFSRHSGALASCIMMDRVKQ
jgi:hypothetical protein